MTANRDHSILQPSAAALWECAGGARQGRRSKDEAERFLLTMVDKLLPPALLKACGPTSLLILLVENYATGPRYRAQLVVVDVDTVPAVVGGSLGESIRSFLSLTPNQWALLAVYRELDEDGNERLLVMKKVRGFFVRQGQSLQGSMAASPEGKDSSKGAK